MFDFISMWKNPKMIAFTFMTALLYIALLYPFHGLNFFGGSVDFGRMAIGIPVAFSFLFGPAAAWGAAIGNLLYGVATSPAPFEITDAFGFFGNFLIGYIPYKLWAGITSEKPDLRSVKKPALFIGTAVMASTICGLLIAGALLWQKQLPFVMTFIIITTTNALWAIVVGSIVLASSYGFISQRKLLYTDILGIKAQPSWIKVRAIAVLVFAITAVLCVVLPGLFTLDTLVILPLVMVALVATAVACK
jgi:energy-coupling factor transport system substrate-specific component